MRRVLISTVPGDLHAAAVMCALERKGYAAVPWYETDLPQRRTASVRVAPDRALTVAFDDTLVEADAVWLRRHGSPVTPEDVYPADRPMVERELETFSRSLLSVIAPGAFWMNPFDGMRRANNKLVQLREARAAGLSIPETLVSNDPARIRGFLREHGAVVYKPLKPSLWSGPDGMSSTFTSVIGEDVLPPDDILRLTPGIFQPLVPKRHELRVTVIGGQIVTVRIDSQHDNALRIDWRATGGRPPIEVDTLPAAAEEASRAVMARLGIVFGCFDFIVTPAGDLVFLEVNEAGQWLWIEEALPETRLLDRITEVLAQARVDAAWPAAAPVTFRELEDQVIARMRAEEALHVPSADSFVASEDTDDAEPGVTTDSQLPSPDERATVSLPTL